MSDKTDPDFKLLSHGRNTNTGPVNLMPWISFCVALVAVIGCLYMVVVTKAYKQEQLQILQSLRETQGSFSKYKAEAAQLPDNIEIVLQDLMDQIRAQKNSTKDLESLVVSDLKPQVNFLLSAQQPKDLTKYNINSEDLLVKVLGLAELHLSVFQDIKKTKELLTFAQQFLTVNDDVAYIKLKETIEKDKQSLTAIVLPDKDSIWSSLDTLFSGVAQYAYKKSQSNIGATQTIMEDKSIKNKKPKKTQILVKTTGWRLALKKTWDELKTLVKIKRNNSSAETLTTFIDLAESLQRERLRMLLEQVRLASFCGDNKVYKVSLTTAKNILTEYFAPEDELNKKAMAELDLLAAINIKPSLPMHINSFKELETILKLDMESVQQ